MKTNKKIKLFLVDDDALYLKSLKIDFLETCDYEVETFATGELCLQHLSLNPDIIILDYHLNGIDKSAINGLETLDKIKAIHSATPVVMLSAQDKIDVAINCMRHKALDYVVKSETAFMRIQKIIDSIVQFQKVQKELNWYMDRM